MAWRTGVRYAIHVYDGDIPIATFHNAIDAMRAVRAVNETDVLRAENIALRGQLSRTRLANDTLRVRLAEIEHGQPTAS